MVDDDWIDIEALEAVYASSPQMNSAAEDSDHVLELIDLIADDHGVIHITNTLFPITLVADVAVIKETIDGAAENPVYQYQFSNDLTIMSDAEINIVSSIA